MGHKISPKALRLGYIKDWDSKWFNLRDMPSLIEEDFHLRNFLKKQLKLAAVSKIGIERTGKYLRLNIYTARPGIVIGRKGSDIETLRQQIEAMTGRDTAINVMEIKRPELDAQLVAEAVAIQLEKQVNYRRAVKRAMERTMNSEALGIKVMVSGRLGGVEIARREWFREGRVPLHTLRAEIDYGFAEALITMGRIGVKVWIFRRELFKKTEREMWEEVRKAEKEKVKEVTAEELEGKQAAGSVLEPSDDSLATDGRVAGKVDDTESVLLEEPNFEEEMSKENVVRYKDLGA